MKICLFDPGFADNEGLPSLNLGDVFIQDAVNREIKDLFDKIELTSISTHTFPPDKILKKLNNNSFIFLGGTNILSSNLNRYRQWRISVSQMLMLPRVILFGVGWHSYQGKINTFSRLFLNFLLSKNSIHSVRDSYTQKKLKSIGFKNVCNTGCPTMWPLQNYTSDSYPVKKAKHALVMLTDYAKDRYLDYRLLNIVKDQYEKIFFWPQGSGDLEYFSEIIDDNKNFVVLERSMESFNKFLINDIDFDYIGTRLHGGIKCLLSKKRSIIIEVDNRAVEVAKDTNLPTIKRDNFKGVVDWINNPRPTDIKINVEEISLWKSQFLNKNAITI